MRTLCTLLLIAVIAIVTKERTSRYLLVEVDNKETSELRQGTRPVEGISYGDALGTNALVYFVSGIKNWQACGSLCDVLLVPEKCKFWTWSPFLDCWLFKDDQGLHVSYGHTSGTAECYE